MVNQRRQLLRFAFEAEGISELAKLDLEFLRTLLLEYDQGKHAFGPTAESLAFGAAIDYWRRHGAPMPPHAIERLGLPPEEMAKITEAVASAVGDETPFVPSDLAGIVDALRRHWIVASMHQGISTSMPTNFDAPERHLEAMLERLRRTQERASADGRKAVMSLGDVADEQIAAMQELRESPGCRRGLPSGFTTFDERHGGLYSSELTIIAGRMKSGKSTLLLSVLVEIWLAHHHVMLFNREMHLDTQFRRFSAMQLMRREIAGDMLAPSWEDELLTQLKFGRLDDTQMDAYTSVWDAAREYPYQLFVTDPKSVRRLDDIERLVRRYRNECGIEAIAIDSGNIQEGSTDDAWNQSDEQKRIADRLVDIAIDNDVHVIVDVQTNRDQGTKASAGLECVALSDWWARNAHNVLRVWPLGPGTGEVQVLASREGPSGYPIPVVYDLRRAIMRERGRTEI